MQLVNKYLQIQFPTMLHRMTSCKEKKSSLRLCFLFKLMCKIQPCPSHESSFEFVGEILLLIAVLKYKPIPFLDFELHFPLLLTKSN